MMALLRALPDIARLVARLVRDPAVPRVMKVVLAAAAVYRISPIDLIPDFVPIAGYLDDLLVAAVVVDGVLNHVDRSLLLRHWPRTEQALDAIGRAARVLSAWLPRRIKRRIFAAG
jgi:uncharacterized membrane protein YkvA (DUF1232 family)